ncbi:hypothetical protein J4727_04920 [Providencia rettgeri]|uniref:DUF262 domain-containing protein n=1 Tax=Providencia rettgeri TaxID=587 RepID=A0A939NAB3_PRORE|nr:hypothetical protein [Providencia rettgeri]
MVLDGQQRLQSFYLALKGSIDGQVLHFNLLSGAESINEEIRYHFEFKDDKPRGLDGYVRDYYTKITRANT